MSISVAAVVLRDEVGRVLTVRKRGTELFMFPGGKPEPGETMPMAAVREVREELGIDLGIDSLTMLGTFTSAAANEPGETVEATVFTHPSMLIDGPSAEIEEIRWVLPNGSAAGLAPLLRDEVFPALG
ncbi:NUDIX hydrolase [Corynebacterium doosanense]|uniref:NUDIX hydrolase n=1 Tax=Corynebacterium doosanense CAU 212 = DSM 45436 TaxID=558173 RepID=A0A097IHQ8_9CORY|nr:NUDIX domain-containing protein [Corynebacterium doosanense]AIT61659.1 NUDIX hydrolase [Corynebacterium doosanense CAU 212 = DSM 45436]